MIIIIAENSKTEEPSKKTTMKNREGGDKRRETGHFPERVSDQSFDEKIKASDEVIRGPAETKTKQTGIQRRHERGG